MQRSNALFLLTFNLMVAGVAVAGYLSFRNYERQFRTQVEDQLAAIADLKVKGLANWRGERMGDGQAVQRNPAFAALVQRVLENRTDATAQAQLQAWLDALRSAYQYNRAFLVDTTGKELISSPATPEPVAAHLAQELAAVMSAGQVTFLDLHHDTPTGPIHLSILVPIRAEQDNRPLGLLVLRIDPNVYLYPFIQQWPVPSVSAESSLVRREGNDVLYLNDLKFQPGAALNLRVPLENRERPAVKAVLGQEGIVEGVNYRGVPVLAALRAVPDSPWFLIARVDAAEAYAPLRDRLWQTLFSFGALLVIGGAGLLLLWQQQRARYDRAQIAAAQALRESEERFRRLSEAAQEGIAIHDHGVIVEANEALARMFGYELDELIGTYAEKLATPESWQIILQNIASGYDKPYEAIGLRKDGSTFWCELIGKPYTYQGRALRVGVFRDITERKKAQEALSRAAQEWQATFDATKDAIWIMDTEQRVLRLNRTAAELFSPEGGSFCDKHCFEVVHNTEQPIPECPFLRAKLSLRRETMDLQLGDKWFQVSVDPILNADGDLVGSVHIVTDITERRRAEEHIRYQASLLENVSDAIVATDMQFVIRSWNKGAEALYGWTTEEAIGKSFGQVVPTSYPSNDRDEVWAQFLAEGHWQGEVIQTRRDGTQVNVLAAVTFIRDSSGNPIGAVAINRDITEQKQAEEKIRESEEKYRLLAETTRDIILLHDMEGRITYVNQSGLDFAGFSLSEALGHSIADFIPPEYLPDLAARHARRLAGDEQTYLYEIEFVNRAGQRIPVEVNSTPISRAGIPAQFLIVARDITARKQAEAQLQAAYVELQRLLAETEQSRWALLSVVEDQKRAEEEIRNLNIELEQRVQQRTAELQAANRELEAFAYSVSHDLRAPLRALEGFSAALLAKYRDRLDEQGQHYLDRIQAATQRMGDLINDLLTLSRVTRYEMTRQEVDLSALAREIATELQAQDPQRQVEIIIAEGMVVYGDAHLLHIALRNLLDNAWKFTGPRPKAHIEVGMTDRAGERIYFVHDNGVGFDMAYADKLFVPFQRLHAAHEFPGTGIGLATVQRIITRHGGRVWAEAEVNQGTTFYFTLAAGG